MIRRQWMSYAGKLSLLKGACGKRSSIGIPASPLERRPRLKRINKVFKGSSIEVASLLNSLPGRTVGEINHWGRINGSNGVGGTYDQKLEQYKDWLIVEATAALSNHDTWRNETLVTAILKIRN